MLPQPLIEEYWNRVTLLVKKRCGISDKSACDAVVNFRQEVEPKAGDMIYHENVESVAETVASAVENGLHTGRSRKGA